MNITNHISINMSAIMITFQHIYSTAEHSRIRGNLKQLHLVWERVHFRMWEFFIHL